MGGYLLLYRPIGGQVICLAYVSGITLENGWNLQSSWIFP